MGVGRLVLVLILGGGDGGGAGVGWGEVVLAAPGVCQSGYYEQGSEEDLRVGTI